LLTPITNYLHRIHATTRKTTKQTSLSPLYNYLLIHRLGLRTDGAAMAVLCCQATNCALIGGYRVYRDHIAPRRRAGGPRETHTFAGYDPRSALQGWGAYLKLGIPAAAMICFEWWVWELCIAFAGWLPSPAVAVSTQGIAMQVSSLFYMLPASLGSATATRVANSLGAGNARGAALVFRVALTVGLTLGLASAVAISCAAGSLARLFTGDAAVVAAARVVLPFVALSLLGDSGVAVLSCVLRAAGRQALGAGLNIFRCAAR
jgi:MATE family multidrug resistance protein